MVPAGSDFDRKASAAFRPSELVAARAGVLPSILTRSTGNFAFIFCVTCFASLALGVPSPRISLTLNSPPTFVLSQPDTTSVMICRSRGRVTRSGSADGAPACARFHGSRPTKLSPGLSVPLKTPLCIISVHSDSEMPQAQTPNRWLRLQPGESGTRGFRG